MMVHKMKLQPKYFDYIKYGTKRIELRLYDEKRKNIQLDDEIIFLKEPEQTESIKTKVVALLRYKSFADLLDDFDISVLADNSLNKEELLKILQDFYSIEEQLEFGVLGIKIEIV